MISEKCSYFMLAVYIWMRFFDVRQDTPYPTDALQGTKRSGQSRHRTSTKRSERSAKPPRKQPCWPPAERPVPAQRQGSHGIRRAPSKKKKCDISIWLAARSHGLLKVHDTMANDWTKMGGDPLPVGAPGRMQGPVTARSRPRTSPPGSCRLAWPRRAPCRRPR